jgi:pyruvate/2-oxoglutarate dehydrogenase complex dihydrolipoamide acyltransferase (E2) component
MSDIVVPELGARPTEPIVVSCWLVDVGDEVIEGDRVVELLLGEITFDVASPATGRLERIAVEVDDPVRPGDVLGTIADQSMDAPTA